ncbi:MAG TPA: RNA polymerase sigma factor [Flavisolibacter sp.]|jgi:RNA polymerase sigma-70 factor (ECF subfamily)|nr:RNA polymerase sigma factor [Flavisolibacter sp.]
MSTQEFNSLVINSAEGLRPFAITLTRDHEVAKDLCQETLCKAFTYRDKYEPGTNIKAWLFTIMRNIFINEYRRNNRKKAVMETVKVSVTPYALSSEVGVRIKEINAAIHYLPSIFKKACLLYLDGYKYHEIALALNEPLGTIKSRIHFAKKMLQKQIDR